MGMIDYGTAGSIYSENFDSLELAGTHSWSDNSTVEGWYAAMQGANSAPANYSGTSGTSSFQGSLISAGATGQSDRALSSQQSAPSGGANLIGASFSNSTGSTLTSFSLDYNGEQWRYIGGEPATVMEFEYQIFSTGAGSLTAGSGWTGVSSLDFTAPETGSSSSSVDGNNEGRVSFSETISSIEWADGEELWIRWSVTGQTQRAIVGVDDVAFSAIPEPSTSVMLLGFASLVTVCAGRRARLK